MCVDGLWCCKRAIFLHLITSDARVASIIGDHHCAAACIDIDVTGIEPFGGLLIKGRQALVGVDLEGCHEAFFFFATCGGGGVEVRLLWVYRNEARVTQFRDF